MLSLQSMLLALSIVIHAQCAVTCFDPPRVSRAQERIADQSCHDQTDGAPRDDRQDSPLHLMNDCAGSVTEAKVRINLKPLTFDIALSHPVELIWMETVMAAAPVAREDTPPDSLATSRPILRI